MTKCVSQQKIYVNLFAVLSDASTSHDPHLGDCVHHLSFHKRSVDNYVRWLIIVTAFKNRSGHTGACVVDHGGRNSR